MDRGRLEAFSDGVIAILITIMVLELKVPHEPTFAALRGTAPVLCSYLLSFVFLGIYWNNHHHMLHVTRRVNGRIMWANLHLLFWLSLVPFVTAWMGETEVAPVPTAMYGVVLWLSAIAYTILQATIVADQGSHSIIKRAVGDDLKAKASLACYMAAIPLAFVSSWISCGLYVLVAAIWLVPDRRLEVVAAEEHGAVHSGKPD